jgi:hypothetical protein
MRLGGLLASMLGASLMAATARVQSCGTVTQAEKEPDPRAVLQAHLSHGLGESPFDSPLIHDSLAAAIIVAARDCPAVLALQRRYGVDDEEGGLLERLRDARLVEERDERLCAAFPIVTAEMQDRYVRLTDAVAQAAYDDLAADLTALLDLIRERGWRDWEYHFVWSQLFDSQFAWAEMVTRELVPPLTPVFAWVVFPSHAFRSGTNYYPDTELRDYWLMVTWRAGGANTTDPVGRTWELLYRAGIHQQPVDDRERHELEELGILGSDGTIEFPVIRQGDPLHTLLHETARRYVQYLARHLPYEGLAEVGGVNRQQAFAMAYHDISWGILDRLSRSALIYTPPALKRQEQEAGQSMRGVFAAAPAYPPFVDLILAALVPRQDLEP